MADVAAQAGVSVMTVSRVLNGFAGVTEETRVRVEEGSTRSGTRRTPRHGCWPGDAHAPWG